MRGHLERIGGMLVSPRRTLARLLDTEEGRMWSILGWMALLAVALEPSRFGRALLLARVDLLDGFFLLFDTVARRLVVPLVGVMAAAYVLELASRGGERPMGVDRALDVASHLLVPFLLLAGVGASASALGVEMWALPHRPLQGPTWVVTVRAVVGFGGSVVLLGLALAEVRARRSPGVPLSKLADEGR